MNNKSPKILNLSIVIPLFNEENNIRPLYHQLHDALNIVPGTYEIVFIDDGSSDNSYKTLEEISAIDQTVRTIQLRQNYGKSTALEVGFEFSTGETIITMDADLQDDPRDIPSFLEKISEGFDLVSGWRIERQDTCLKKLSSLVFNKTTSFLTGISLHDFNCGYKAYRKEVISQLELLPDFHRFIPALASLQGYRVGEIIVRHHPRFGGHSKYGLSRYPAAFFNLITMLFLNRYATKPLFFFGGLGLLLFCLGFLLSSYLALEWFRGFPIGHRPALLLGVLLIIVGIQLGSFGLLAELFLRHYRKKDSQGFIRKTSGFSS